MPVYILTHLPSSRNASVVIVNSAETFPSLVPATVKSKCSTVMSCLNVCAFQKPETKAEKAQIFTIRGMIRDFKLFH